MAAKLSGLIIDHDFKSLKNWLTKHHFSQIFILCDRNTQKKCVPFLRKIGPLKKAVIISIAAGEHHKTLQSAELVWQTLFNHRADRKALLMNVGGGMITDLGGFCAAVYKRGIATVHIPTSVMAMADASIGGKTGVDTCDLKNALGAFHQPMAIFTSPRFLTTLSAREYNSGFAEVCKMGIVADRQLWQLIKSRNGGKNDMAMIERAAAAKLSICERDPFDRAARKILNFGHTAGHGIESWFLYRGKPIPHGEAVAAGMLVECHIAMNKKLLAPRTFSEIAGVLQQQLALPKLNAVSLKDISGFILNDKKNDGGKILLALPTKIGHGGINVPCSLNDIGRGLAYYQTLKP